MNKKNIPLLIGATLPILMILVVTAIIYIPGFFTKPTYNFLYMTGYSYGYNPLYFVSNGQIMENNVSTTSPVYYQQGQPELFVYNVATNESQSISYADAKQFSLNSNDTSPDGFTVTAGNDNGGFFPFFYSSDDSNNEYLVGHNVSKALNIQNSGNYYGDFTFLGWINH